MATNFATRYKKDLSTQTLKTKLVRRKSLFQKESRHKEFNRGRQFGPVDVNTQASRDRELSRLDETGEERTSKPSQIPHAAPKAREQERFEMLQRYKAEKELRKLKEQREKPIFKCGRFKPEDPSFLPKGSQIPVLSRAKEAATKASSTETSASRLTRSKAKTQLQEPVRPQLSVKGAASTGKNMFQGAPKKQTQIYIDKPPSKLAKEVQPPGPAIPNGRVTRAAAAAAAAKTKIPQASRPAATAGNLPQKRTANKGKPQRGAKGKDATACEMKENTPLPPKKEEERTSLEDKTLPASRAPPAPLPLRRERSFAPQNFVFQPLQGLAAYQVKPMSPVRARVFLSPDLVWSPAKSTSKLPEDGPKDCKDQAALHPKGTKDQAHTSALEPPAPEEELVPQENMEVDPLAGQSPGRQEDPPAMETTELDGAPQHDVPYFRKILRAERQRLASHCEEWDGAAETDIPEDAKDLIRTTVGQTRLLLSERFMQFEGLVDNCEFRRGEKETMCGDLDGFWDMVSFQVEDVNKKFENLMKLRANGWEVVEDVQPKKACKKKAPAPPLRATKARGESAERKAARKRLASIKAAVKSKLKLEGPEAEAVGLERPPAPETLVFDGGFFQIESPAKPLAGWTPRSSDRLSRRATPRSATKALLRSCVDTCIVRQGTPTPSKPVPPLPDLDGEIMGPSASDLLGSISEQSEILAVKESIVTTKDEEEEAVNPQETPMAACDNRSCSAPTEPLGPVTFQEEIESPPVTSEVQEATVEAENPAGDLENILCSPEKESPMEGIGSWIEEQHPPEDPLEEFASDTSYGSKETDDQANPDASLFFTPLRTKAENHTGVPSCDDLIVFSPLPLPEGGN